MKPTTKASCLVLAGSLFMLLGVFGRPLGIPPDFESVPILVAVVFIYFGYRVSNKAKDAGLISKSTNSQKRKHFILIVTSCGAACVAMPFVLPVTGVNLPFPELVVICVVSFFICIGAAWVGIRMRT